MTNDEDSGGGKTSGDFSASAGTGQKKESDGHPNGDVGFGNGSSGVGSTGSKSDESDDHLPLETDALQPKMVKSKSSNKVKEAKEVNSFFFLFFIDYLCRYKMWWANYMRTAGC